MREFTDENGNMFETNKEIGRGAQGVVYKTKNADIAVKLILENEKEIKDENKIKLIQKNIKRIIYKPFPKNIAVAKPLSVLKDKAGYIMYLLEDMKPLLELFPQKLKKEVEIEMPFFLEEYAKKDKRGAEFIAFYLKSGSLRKRLKLLSRLGAVLHRLYCRGMIYADISYNNIFFNDNSIYLIDTDNIEYAHSFKGCVYTPEFEVPEIKRGESNSIYSDIYAYAILSFYLLTMIHPFDGELLNNDWDKENKNIWEIPWIEDSKDSSNESKKVSLRGALTMTSELDALFHSVFEDGRVDKLKRDSLPLWIESFEKAYSITLKCPKCGMTYYDTFSNCPYCDSEKPKRIEFVSYYQNGTQRWKFIKEIKKQISIKSYLFKPFEITKIDDEFLKIVKGKDTYDFIFKTTDKLFINKRPKTDAIYTIPCEELEKGIEIKINTPIEIIVKIRIYE